MYSPLADPSAPLGIGLVAMVVLLVWGMRAVAPEQRGAVARIVGTHVGVTTAVLGMLSVYVAGSVGGAANPFIGRVIQVFVSVAMVTLVSIIATKRIGDLRGAAADDDDERGGAGPDPEAHARPARTSASGAGLVLALLGMFAAFLLLMWLVLSSVPR